MKEYKTCDYCKNPITGLNLVFKKTYFSRHCEGDKHIINKDNKMKEDENKKIQEAYEKGIKEKDEQMKEALIELAKLHKKEICSRLKGDDLKKYEDQYNKLFGDELLKEFEESRLKEQKENEEEEQYIKYLKFNKKLRLEYREHTLDKYMDLKDYVDYIISEYDEWRNQKEDS